MSCSTVRIKVRNLSKAAQNRLGGQTEVVLDLPEDFALPLYKSIETASRANTIKTEAALGAAAPGTPTNDAIFIEYNSLLTIDNEKRFYDVVVEIEGHELVQFNRLYIKERKAKQWEFELRRSPDHWVELAKEFTIDRLDYGTFVFIQDNIVDNWALPAYEGDYTDPNTGQAPTYWPVIDYGGWCDLTQPPQGSTARVRSIAVEDVRPLISLPYILRAGACAIGWTCNGVIFDTELMRRAWVYALKSDYYTASKDGGRIIGRNMARSEPKNTISTMVRFTELSQGIVSSYLSAVGGGYLMGIRNFQGVSLAYRYKLIADFTNEKAVSVTLVIRVMVVEDQGGGNLFVTGEVLSPDIFTVEIAAGATETVIFEQDIVHAAFQMAAIFTSYEPTPYSSVFMEKGAFFSIIPINNCLMSTDSVFVGDCVSSESLLDFIKATSQVFRLDVETDWTTKTFTFYPRNTSDAFGETVPGFFKTEAEAVDISDRVICDSEVVRPLRQDLKRYTRIEYANSTDAYISSLNLSQPAHSRTILNGNDLPDGVDSIQNIIIEPSLEERPLGVYLGSGAGGRHPLPYLPRLWDNTEGQRSFNIGPRLLFAFGLARQVNPEPITPTDELTSFFFNYPPNPSNTGLVTQFGYVTMGRTWELETPPAVDGNFSFQKSPQDLFTSFYLGFTQAERNGFEVEVLQQMQVKDYVRYNFRDLFKFTLRGRQIIAAMTDIRDFQPGIPTPVKFLQVPVTTSCCDNPCGCSVTECEYYQDFGPFITQATLDALLITSFKVDNIELLSAPVSLGDIKIVNIAGQPYVTNLVDALNSIAAPYFLFSYSTRSHVSKGKRFFKIKRPTCYSFKIIVQLSGVDCYLYTDTEQATAYFTPGTWNALGYGGETYTAPDNCLTVTEY